ncbi:hypothetical protein SSX86_016051 [Deinandra increscens subsp. villosa]|uniref:RING-type E3 ubiquitin transferase n=1 Tax=Deinandra increscens subsp. villosa TaxID=3103831 RepID=A0AAP0CXC5_9ASTR
MKLILFLNYENQSQFKKLYSGKPKSLNIQRHNRSNRRFYYNSRFQSNVDANSAIRFITFSSPSILQFFTFDDPLFSLSLAHQNRFKLLSPHQFRRGGTPPILQFDRLFRKRRALKWSNCIMGSLCSCFRAPEPDDESLDSDDDEQVQDSSDVANRNAQDNFTLFLQNLTNKCEAVLGRRGTETSSWFYQGQSSSHPTIEQIGSSESSSSDSGISFMRHEKGSNRSRVEPELDCESNFQSIPSEEGSKKYHSEIPLMVAADNVKSNVNTISVDDEDVCPICLEEYTIENPRIMTKCSHHYHLSCIYEWNERSETCPVCSKLMVFEEMA